MGAGEPAGDPRRCDAAGWVGVARAMGAGGRTSSSRDVPALNKLFTAGALRDTWNRWRRHPRRARPGRSRYLLWTRPRSSAGPARRSVGRTEDLSAPIVFAPMARNIASLQVHRRARTPRRRSVIRGAGVRTSTNVRSGLLGGDDVRRQRAHSRGAAAAQGGGRSRSIGISIHDRQRAGRLAEASPIGVFMLRYTRPSTTRAPRSTCSRTWRGAVQRPGLYRHMRGKDRRGAEGLERVTVATAAEDYRFCWSSPHVDEVRDGASEAGRARGDPVR